MTRPSNSTSARQAASGVLLVALLAAACAERQPASGPAAPPQPVSLPPVAEGELRAPEIFASIGDRDERSRALFTEVSRVLLHPRCVNCHPSDDAPRQLNGELHEPPVFRGANDRGIPGLECTSCHQDRNIELARVPGAPGWHLAPKSMAWQNRSLKDICEQIKDPARNGGKNLAQILEHSGHDELVAWGWAPGSGRTPAPGTQAGFAALVAAWMETGAACPREEARR